MQKINPNNNSPVVAIDGPAGSGKSTVAKLVSQKLNLLYVDTGAMFRALAIYFTEKKIPLEKIEEKDLKGMVFSYSFHQDGLVSIQINHEDYTAKLRSPKASELSSIISTNQAIRDFLLQIQRELPKNRPCCMEGRDIGSIVFPNAKLKVYLTADVQVRAQRRRKDLLEMGVSTPSDIEQVKKEMLIRDARDSQREFAPLKIAEDAIILDSTNMSLEEVTQRIVQWALERNIQH